MNLDSVVRYCTEEALCDSEMERELAEIEIPSDEEELERGISEDAEVDRVENLLQEAYSQMSASCSMTVERDSLLLLDPDIGK